MSCVLRLSVLLLLVAAMPARLAEGEDEPKPLRISATSTVPLRRSGLIRIDIEPDGSTRVTQAARVDVKPSLVLTLRLTPEELDQGRRAVVAARFFESWGAERPALHEDLWNVTVRLGDVKRARASIGTLPAFKPLREYLFRFVTLADIVAGLRRGESDLARSTLRSRSVGRIVQPSVLVTELVACAAGREDPTRCAAVAKLLVALPASKDWLRGANELLPRIEGERRAAVLAAWAGELRAGERAAHRAAFAPLALTEVAATWQRWLSMGPTELRAFWFLLSMLLRDGTPQASEIAEQMARTLGAPGKPVVSPGLLATGTAAIPIVRRLLEAPEPGARASGAEMAYIQIRVVRGKMGIGIKFTADVLAALERRFGEEIVPLLERLAQDAAESYAVRQTCLHALDHWDGRVKAAKAQARALREAERERVKAERSKRVPATPPAGTLAIAGRLLGPSDIPLPGFGVHAKGLDGRSRGSAATAADGSFRIGGLAAGAHDLSYTIPHQSARWAWARSSPTATGVAAGTEGVILRLSGSLIRGRLVDAAGAPVLRRRVIAQMRNAPSVQGPAYGSAFADTDGQGRFWLVQLLPGVYDLQVVGHRALHGATGIEAGPEQRTVRLLTGTAIAGRLVDETGAPMGGVRVSLSESAPRWDTLQSATTRHDGTFRLVDLDASRRYRVWAQLPSPTPRVAVAEDVVTGTLDLELRMDTTPRLRFRVDFGKRGPGWGIRVERVGGGPRVVHSFTRSPVNWPAAPPGTWKVSAQVRDVDGQGKFSLQWLEVGTATTGEPEKTLTVPQ